MAGLIARLFGGKESPAVDMEPKPGIGGYTLGAGPANQTGFPGSTSQTRVFRRPPNSPRVALIEADTDTGFEQGLGPTTQTRQAAYRGDVRGAALAGPRRAPEVVTPQTSIGSILQNNSDKEFYGGPQLKTGPGNNTAGANPLSPAQYAGGHSQRDTTTPWYEAEPVIAGDPIPGSNNVRNTIAERYKNPAGQSHTYKSAPRADQAPMNQGGQATDGNVHPERVVQDVTVPNRAVFPEITWSVEREMPYGGRGDGARGADLNGSRYYATGQADQFGNAGQGEYGKSRQLGGKRPVNFTQPAPWTANFYDTTSSVGSQDDPNTTPDQQPTAVYYSAGGLRATNGTGRTG